MSTSTAPMPRADRPDVDLRALIAPRSIAIVGASDNRKSWGGRALGRLVSLDYPGRVYPVHQRQSEIQGLRAYPTLDALPERPDHVVIAVGAQTALSVYGQCKRLDVPAATMFAAGFNELDSDEGAALGTRLAEIVDAPGATRLLGPNCGGWVNFPDRCALTGTATLSDMTIPVDGDIGIVSTSGGVGHVSVMWRAARLGLRIRYVVTTGNEADVALSDIVLALVEDPAVRTVLIYAEQLKDPRTLIRAAERAAANGTVLAIAKIGRTAAGQAAARSHTGAMAGDDRVWEGLFRQLGIIRVDDVVDLSDIALANVSPHPPRSTRAASVAISGGHLAVLADVATARGLEFPELAPATRSAVDALLPDFGAVRNPVDVTSAGNDAAALAAAFEVVAADAGVDLLLPLMTHAPAAMIEAISDVLLRADKYGAMIWTGGCYNDDLTRADVVARGLPCFDAAGRGSAAVASLAWAYRVGRRIATTPPVGPSIADGLIAHDETFLEQGMADLLAAGGFAGPRQQVARSADEAVAKADAVGYPVAVKLLSVRVVHKAKVSGLALGLTGPDQVREAFESIAQVATVHGESPRVLVQQMISGGTELVLGLTSVPELGCVLMFGQGGSQVETVKDVTFWSPAARDCDPEEILGATRVGALFGVGNPDLDRDLVVTALDRWTAFGRRHGSQFDYVDINPLVVAPKESEALVLDVAYQLRSDITT